MVAKKTKLKPRKKTNSKKAIKATKRKTTKKVDKKILEKAKSSRFYDQLNLDESYVSLVMGGIVVFAIFLVGFILIYDSRVVVEEQRVLNSTISPTPEEEYVEEYTMLEGESLWDVAVKYYGDGFAWIKIVEANPEVIENPDYVPPGTVIIIPE